MSTEIFSLDIGTRTVKAVVAEIDNKKLCVKASAVREHRSRSMFDGQVHDIEMVSEVVKEVKHDLEKSIGYELSSAAIAAAGRSLITIKTRIDMDIDDDTEIDKEFVNTLELNCIKKAENEVKHATGNQDLYCVGYSTIAYYLNDSFITNLAGHRGKKAGVEVIATFLPKMVVDSLFTVVEKSGLGVSFITLEPIAAINMAIPSELRLLNLGLVDIGAGTSDIAITKDGSVFAYGMVPMAGDEVTEAIEKHYLIDFNTAENIKLSLGSRKSVSFKDILGNKIKVSRDEVYEVIKPVISNLAHEIAKVIIEYNKKAPSALFLVGGSSQLPFIKELLADELKMPSQRITVKKRTDLSNVIFDGKILSGPDAITPLGIAITAATGLRHNFLRITVNDRDIKLLNTKIFKVKDAVIEAGIGPEELFGARPKGLQFYFNDELIILRGEPARPGQIILNGNPASLESVIGDGDEINIIPARPGKEPVITVGEFANMKNLPRDGKILINGAEVPLDRIIREGDRIIYKPKEEDSIKVIINGQTVKIPGDKGLIFVDIFKYYPFDLNNPKGNKIVLKLNRMDASYTDAIRDGDNIEIYWE
ncbi:cell division protein FtsA [Calorimonas adulescens]|uniref:Chaperone protein DnaK n=1 Tax=Calorimonas adulescens TaxID=2606906 RepID=A0A5D8QFC4_9THEO|nr:cell division FtsA domain-containing protein [Calorimonas adulescens]TZE83127.1 cell division protein FtsA [Calorimonas adulescens]